MVRRDDAVTIGFCGLKPGAPDTPIAHDVEAGWVIARECWRQGYAAEAMRAVLDRGWRDMQLSRIVAITARRNAASRGMMARLGMEHRSELDFRHPAFHPDDPLADVVAYVVERPDGHVYTPSRSR